LVAQNPRHHLLSAVPAFNAIVTTSALLAPRHQMNARSAWAAIRLLRLKLNLISRCRQIGPSNILHREVVISCLLIVMKP
jgi:hypothetical protein